MGGSSSKNQRPVGTSKKKSKQIVPIEEEEVHSQHSASEMETPRMEPKKPGFKLQLPNFGGADDEKSSSVSPSEMGEMKRLLAVKKAREVPQDLRGKPQDANLLPVIDGVENSLEILIRETSRMKNVKHQEECLKKQAELLNIASDLRHIAKKWKVGPLEKLDREHATLVAARKKLHETGLIRYPIDDEDDKSSDDSDLVPTRGQGRNNRSDTNREEIENIRSARRGIKNITANMPSFSGFGMR
jgi:hypothetical protein